MKRVTIIDVAKKAGVSKSTVSHVVNETRFVTPDTKQRVVQAINELNYRPSVIARSLTSHRTKTAGLLISDVGNPFYHDVIMGVEEVALANGYSVFLCNTSYNLDRGSKIIHSLIDKSVDGILFMSSSMTMEMVHEVTRAQIHTVVLDWGVAPVEELTTTITINFREGIEQAIKYLVELGHKHIAYVSGPLNLWTAQIRKDAFCASMEHNKLDPEEAFITQGNLRIDGGQRALARLIQQDPRPTAVLAANDLTALGILWAAPSFGLQLPDDLSVIGLDNIDLASKVKPSLTTIDLPRYEIGKLAMEMLLEAIESPVITNNKREVSTQLIVRESTTRLVDRQAYVG